MNRLDAMADRLPPVYAIEEGSLLRQVLAVLAVELATFDEEMDRVQRSHWVRTAFTKADLQKLGRLVDVEAASWESEGFFRDRLLALTAARLEGAVTWAPIRKALVSILDGAEADLGLRLSGLRREPEEGEPALPPHEPELVEFPTVDRRSDALLNRGGLVRALDRFVAHNHSFRATWMTGVVRGLSGGRTAVPLIVNRRNGHAVGYAGLLRAGEELWLSAADDGKLTARLSGLGRELDVSDRLVTTRAFPDGTDAVEPLGRDAAPTAIELLPGDNELWFVPVGLFGERGFDRALFAWPGPDMGQGLWQDNAHAGPGFGDAVFHTPEAVSLDLVWTEARPATFQVHVPTAAVRSDPETDASEALAQLLAVLQSTVDQLRAAGVVAEVVGRPATSTQLQWDGCRVASVHLPPETVSAGVDAELALNAIFSSTIARANRFA